MKGSKLERFALEQLPGMTRLAARLSTFALRRLAPRLATSQPFKLSTFALLLLLACQPPPPPDLKHPDARPPGLERIDGQAIYKLVGHHIAAGPRVAGSAAWKKAHEDIAARASSLGYSVTLDRWSQPRGRAERVFVNVECLLPGKEPGLIVIGSHYDTKKIAAMPKFTGANDGGSSTAALLHLMEIIAADKAKWSSRRSLLFTFYDGEEAEVAFTEGEGDGLFGSYHQVRKFRQSGRLAEVKAMVNFDMIGDIHLNARFHGTPQLQDLLAACAAANNSEAFFEPAGSEEMTDDHKPWLEAGIPALDIIDLDYGPRNSWWHTEDDTLDKLSPASLQVSSQVLLRAIWNLSHPQCLIRGNAP
ncbi:MAG: hypothetical protein RL095_3589 [Verrucomicrobiota bacterium]